MKTAVMTDTCLLDDPIIMESIHEASDELLRRYQSGDNQSVPDTMLLSESALSEWNTEEENIAWASL